MAQEKLHLVCKHYNTGFYKFKGECKSYQPKTVGPIKGCRENSCFNIHPKKCRYEDQCRRRSPTGESDTKEKNSAYGRH